LLLKKVQREQEMDMAALTFTQHLAKLIERSPKTQREIALEIGYSKPNLITMFKQGLTKVPIEVVPRLAKALDEDPAFLLRLALRDYMPKALEVIEANLGPILTEEEKWLIEAHRARGRDAA
jgi:transcriptional regulator with XRE-family HTH domain